MEEEEKSLNQLLKELELEIRHSEDNFEPADEDTLEHALHEAKKEAYEMVGHFAGLKHSHGITYIHEDTHAHFVRTRFGFQPAIQFNKGLRYKELLLQNIDLKRTIQTNNEKLEAISDKLAAARKHESVLDEALIKANKEIKIKEDELHKSKEEVRKLNIEFVELKNELFYWTSTKKRISAEYVNSLEHQLAKLNKRIVPITNWNGITYQAVIKTPHNKTTQANEEPKVNSISEKDLIDENLSLKNQIEKLSNDIALYKFQVDNFIKEKANYKSQLDNSPIEKRVYKKQMVKYLDSVSARLNNFSSIDHKQDEVIKSMDRQIGKLSDNLKNIIARFEILFEEMTRNKVSPWKIYLKEEELKDVRNGLELASILSIQIKKFDRLSTINVSPELKLLRDFVHTFKSELLAL